MVTKELDVAMYVPSYGGTERCSVGLALALRSAGKNMSASPVALSVTGPVATMRVQVLVEDT